MRYYTVETNGAEKTAVSVNGKELYLLPQFADNHLYKRTVVPTMHSFLVRRF